ncbi:Hpt domain-containing protein [Massilia consociata]|uniref:Hpt domain-containing protein n=1 Tax=Massilia consociata TaxID=760117 RepID=A0ABV6FE60_9BURK
MHAADQQFFARLASLNDSFARGLPSTLDRLAALGAELDPNAPAPAAGELAAMLHTVAGSALTFGYRGLGQHARALEQRLRVLMTFDAVAASDWSTWLAELARFVEHARLDPHALS